ncbi:class I SAM-dependent methyltransferase [Stenotrophomonas acidaminiphila]|uniref:class I SAM-dependent DNA methyltransferase n=1 Tax=Stenotrophomonas TaxID=40323 RepID=UPI00137644C0|nr:class I SAM-dependent methyltransferase [Stenotrophomonas acidaminiphila]MPS36138.1 methyltransferase domain-containing protein [Stenotrophomonas sp.]NCT87961.1 class I SAM-dependent methyltransferase [Stenotrophomonas acidaminiphila]WPU54955.1 class I SAM-dependent methyltransferase [Stenotrophomonas acidaminiphila]
MQEKHYDAAYFQHWYRRGDIGGPARLARKVQLAVATAEYYLERPIRSVLDIGCGEGAWRAPLLKLRPKLQYMGFDGSEYAVQRYGRTRNLHLARFGDFQWLRPCAPVDLLVCADVMHYVPSRELRQGLPGLAELCGGVAFLETFTADDEFHGDHQGFQPRPARWYRRQLAQAGFRAAGSHCWLGPHCADDMAALERGG